MTALVSKNCILRIYRTMKANPLKVYIQKDFGGNQKAHHLRLLESLGLVEEVNVRVKRGRKNRATSSTKGWRFLR